MTLKFEFLQSLIRFFKKALSKILPGQKQTAATVPRVHANLSPIYRAPADIIYYLTSSLLSQTDTAALALTCKALWWTIDGRRILAQLNSHKEQRLDFLARLEVSFPKHLLCYPCATFHRRGRVRRTLFSKKCDKEETGELRWFMPFHKFRFWEVKEQMNYHRFGEDYGRPLTPNHPDVGFWHSSHPSCLSIRTRVIADELIIKTDISHLFVPGDLRQGEPRFFLGVYLHKHPFNCVCDMRQYPEVKDGGASKFFFRCKNCLSEVRRIVNPTYSERYGEIRTTTWLNLGRCHSQLDFKWQLAIDGCESNGHEHIEEPHSQYARYFDETSPHRLVKWYGKPLLFAAY